MPQENIDDFIRRLEQDDKESQRLITPVAYGKLRGIAPQQIYYHIRTKKLETEVCDCGRRCIRIEDADELLRALGKLPEHQGCSSADRSERSDRDEDLDRDGQAPEELER